MKPHFGTQVDPTYWVVPADLHPGLRLELRLLSAFPNVQLNHFCMGGQTTVKAVFSLQTRKADILSSRSEH